jgi:hypothetical protein
MGPIIAGTLAAVAPGALAPRAVGIGTPGIDVVALAPGTLERAFFPPHIVRAPWPKRTTCWYTTLDPVREVCGAPASTVADTLVWSEVESYR